MDKGPDADDRAAKSVPAVPAAELASAVGAAVADSGWRDAVGLIEVHWGHYNVSDPSALLAAIKALPGEALIAEPDLLIAANSLRRLLSERATAPTDDFAPNPLAAVTLARRHTDVLDRLTSNADTVEALRTSGRFDEAVQASVDGRVILEAATDAERSALGTALPRFQIQWGRAIELAGGDGAREYEEAYDLAILTDQHELARRSAGSLAWHHADRGRLWTAQSWIERAVAVDVSHSPHDAPLYLAIALVNLDRRNLVASRTALAAASAAVPGEYWAAELWLTALLITDAVDAAVVEDSVEAELAKRPAALVEYGANQRYLAWARAVIELRLRGTLTVAEPSDGAKPWQKLLFGLSAYRSGSTASVLTWCSVPAEAAQSPRVRASALLLLAAAHLTKGNEYAAVHSFSRAHALIERKGLFMLYDFLVHSDLVALLAVSGESSDSISGVDPDEPRLAPNTAVLALLSKRERVVLQHLASGLTVPAIGRALFVSPNTVKATVRSLYAKLEVHSRQEATAIAIRGGLI